MTPALYKGRSLGRPQTIFPAMVIAAAMATLFSLIGIAGVTGHLPNFSLRRMSETASFGVCSDCGIVDSIKAREVDGESINFAPPTVAGKRYTLWQTRVRLDDGSIQVFYNRTPPAWQTGARVKLENGQLVRVPER